MTNTVTNASLDPQAQLPSDWRFEWETFPAADHGPQIFLSTFHKEPWSKPKALFVIHGMGEHGGRFADFAKPLASVVDCVAINDHRGHGRSEGLRGDAPRFDILAEDAGLAFMKLEDRMRRRFGDDFEIHLLGHSLGGLVALLFLDRFPQTKIASVTLSAALIDVKFPVPPVKKFAASILKNVWATLQLPTGLPAEAISRIPEEVRIYKEDRLNHDRMTPRFFESLQTCMAMVRAKPLQRELPIQFLVPLADGIVSPDAEVTYYHQLKQHDKRLKTYEGGFHEAMNDLNQDEFFRDLADWIKIHSK